MLLAFGFYDIVTLAALMFILVSFMVPILVVLGLQEESRRNATTPKLKR